MRSGYWTWILLAGFVVVGTQLIAPMKTIGLSGEVLETRHGFPWAWLIVDMRSGQAQYDFRLLGLIPDLVYYSFLVSVILWGRHKILIRRRDQQGLCRKCDYNLTGNVSGVCPECGEKI